jgi:prepilin signal peptidase PulO-like enzyme (type II secretory pathway)
VGLSAVARGRADGKTKLPLGTFLSAAAIFVLFGGDHLLTWYKGLVGG